ncbi:MAG: D-2-hydroxyacid dehydrogenase [Chitinophagales bacterium]|nr:D-2-hydroxyacid dehydrogenase [Chitinophagales bacterium]MCZ2394723.1 D-2-hydroxyacid dehydrogenase [Chitinophagales bacterium]
MLNIVVIDGYTLNPGDLNLTELQKLGNLRVHPRSSNEELVERLKDAHIAIVNKVVFNKHLIDQLPHLKYIAVTATGYNNLDISYLKQKNILASNVKGYGTFAVAQHTISLILELTNYVSKHHQDCINNKWNQTQDFCFWTYPMKELYQKKMGIIGMGNIGKQVAIIAQALGMEIYYHSLKDKSIPGMKYLQNSDEIFKICDIISLHCSLNHQTEHLINEQSLSLFRPEAILINTSRGGLIDENALKYALDKNIISGAGLDVLTTEPPVDKHHPLIHHPKCIVTPHNAWSSIETRQRLLDMVVDNIKSYIQGNPKNVIEAN